jgi:choline-glycine betaine transporter
MAEELIPIVMFISLAVVLIFLFWFRFRSRESMNETIRLALDKGQELSPEIIERLGQSAGGKYRDLRLGIIWLSIAVGLALVALGVGNFAIEALQGTLASAALPFAIGLGYLLIYYFTGRDKE